MIQGFTPPLTWTFIGDFRLIPLQNFAIFPLFKFYNLLCFLIFRIFLYVQ